MAEPASTSEGLPPPAGVPLSVETDLLDLVRFDAAGLVPAVVQDAVGLTVLTVAYMNRESLQRTIDTGRTWFWSRSRAELWPKGETSGDRQYVREIRLGCEGNSLVVLVDQHGRGACHTGSWSCFDRRLAVGPGMPTDR